MKTAIYIPSLGQDIVDGTVKSYASRMMKAIDENSQDPKKRYKISYSELEYDNEGNISDIVSIYEINNGKQKEIYRFYDFKYINFLTEKIEQSNIIYKFTSLLMVLIIRFLSILDSLFSRNNKTGNQTKYQALYFTIAYIMMTLYLIMLIPSILALVISTLESITQLSSFTDIIKGHDATIKYIVALFSTIMLLYPNSKNILSTMVTEYLAANQYLSIGKSRPLIIGKLTRLIEVISESEPEREIEIHSYSFGTVIALDVIFPYKHEANIRVQSLIKKLITIGCPFDFIDVYWRNYFNNRKCSKVALEEWHNIYSDLDPLSTRFTNNDMIKLIKSSGYLENLNITNSSYNIINAERGTFIKLLLFYGLKAHLMYWDENADSESCLLCLFSENSITNPETT